MLDITIYNAYILYKITKKETLQLSEFRLKLIKEICSKYEGHTQKLRDPDPDHAQLSERHFPSLIPDNKQRRCSFCNDSSHKKGAPNKQSRFECSICNKGLCVDPCFKKYHSSEN